MNEATQMESGEGLDRRVAIHVMGFKPCGHSGCAPANGPDCWHDPSRGFRDVKHFHPSSDIACAFQVVEKMIEVHSAFEFQLDSLGFDGEEWRCAFTVTDSKPVGIGDGPTAALAICRAALDAVNSIKTLPPVAGDAVGEPQP